MEPQITLSGVLVWQALRDSLDDIRRRAARPAPPPAPETDT